MWDFFDGLGRVLFAFALFSLIGLTDKGSAATSLWIFFGLSGAAILCLYVPAFVHPYIFAARANALKRRIAKAHAAAEHKLSGQTAKLDEVKRILSEASKHTERQWYPFGCTAQTLGDWISEGYKIVKQAEDKIVIG